MNRHNFIYKYCHTHDSFKYLSVIKGKKETRFIQLIKIFILSTSGRIQTLNLRMMR